MSWIEKLHETYEQCAGRPQFASNPLLPIGHTTQQAQIEIVLDSHGGFRRASVVSSEDRTTVVPCTEESGGRSGTKPVSHPLCDKLQYLAGDFLHFGGEVTAGFATDPHEPYRTYVDGLSAWASSSYGQPKLNFILAYVRKGQVVQDLIGAGILLADASGRLLKEWGGDRRAAPPIFRVIANPEDSFVRWRVEIPGDPSSGTWEDPALARSWIAYYGSLQSKQGVCMVTGKHTTLAEQHPAKLRNPGDKAKLISSNDTGGYTFRGRFLDGDEACGVGFEVTQKAHNALRWLIDAKRKQAFRNGDQVIVSWAVSGREIPDPFASSFELFRTEALPELSPEEYQGDAGQAFGNRLSKLIAGYRAALGSTEGIVVIGLDSATRGRMAITFYRELTGSEFLDRVQAWHGACAWHQNYGDDPESKRPLRFIGAPSPKEIAEAALGASRDKKRKLHKATIERLLPCIIDGRPLPRDLMESAVRRTCNRAAFEKDRNGREWEWEKDLGIACALFRGFYRERGYNMTLEADRTSRDYLYGRLLAIAEHLEGRALYVADEKRDTNAARLMQRFADRPASTWRSIALALAPYKTRLRARRPPFLHKMEERLDEVVCAFKREDFLDDRKLSGEFLLGYHCERRALRHGDTGTRETDEETADNSSVEGGNS
jgi:CRISPR-associated protein Csd1